MKKILVLFVALCACSVANAQNISLDLRDTPVRSALEMVFKQADIKNFVIDNDVAGIVGRIDVKEQSVESALKLIIRANSNLLTYTVENNVYIVKVRIIKPPTGGIDPIPDLTKELSVNNLSFERISLTFIDPIDLMSAFGDIIFIRQFGRYTGGMNGSGMGNFGGGANNSSSGGNGGFGLGAGNGIGGGAMGGLGGMMGFQGGMGGGSGGFGGGRNF